MRMTYQSDNNGLWHQHKLLSWQTMTSSKFFVTISVRRRLLLNFSADKNWPHAAHVCLHKKPVISVSSGCKYAICCQRFYRYRLSTADDYKNNFYSFPSIICSIIILNNFSIVNFINFESAVRLRGTSWSDVKVQILQFMYLIDWSKFWSKQNKHTSRFLKLLKSFTRMALSMSRS